jgi:hypothetical protein
MIDRCQKLVQGGKRQVGLGLNPDHRQHLEHTRLLLALVEPSISVKRKVTVPDGS